MKIAHSPVIFPAILCLIALSCKKSSPASSPASGTGQGASLGDTSLIVGKWSIVEDTLANINDYTIPDGYPIPGNYFGVAGDYWDFQQNGILIAHENNNDDSATYQVLPDHRITVIRKTEFKNAIIEVLDAHNCSIYGSDTSANGGMVFETLTLKR